MVKSWMAHHQGMSLLALMNFLYCGAMQQWFHSEARVEATELLLQERPTVYEIKAAAGMSQKPLESRPARKAAASDELALAS